VVGTQRVDRHEHEKTRWWDICSRWGGEMETNQRCAEEYRNGDQDNGGGESHQCISGRRRRFHYDRRRWPPVHTKYALLLGVISSTKASAG
jgi:hypothetical protein